MKTWAVGPWRSGLAVLLAWAAINACGAPAAVALAASAASAASATKAVSESSIEPGAHDPTLWTDAQGDWVFTTGRGLPRLHSRDGRHWQRLPPVFDAANRPAWWTAQVPAHDGLDVWAPKLFAHRGRLWVMYSISTFGKKVSAIGLASVALTDGPAASGWRDDGLVLASGEADNFNAIDPDVFSDSDGRLWLSWGSWWQGLQVAELDPDTLRPKPAAGPWQFIARRRGGIEAPTLLRRGDWVYLFMSWGLCCKGVDSTYEIRVGRARSPLGPFVDREGRALMDGGGSLVLAGSGRWKGQGHQDVHGGHMVWHGYDAEAAGQPRLRRAPLRWDADGWPAP